MGGPEVSHQGRIRGTVYEKGELDNGGKEVLGLGARFSSSVHFGLPKQHFSLALF
jgi:hypothetical protein